MKRTVPKDSAADFNPGQGTSQEERKIYDFLEKFLNKRSGPPPAHFAYQQKIFLQLGPQQWRKVVLLNGRSPSPEQLLAERIWSWL